MRGEKTLSHKLAASREGAVPDQALVNSDLQSALAEARQAYIDRNPKSFARHQEACEAMPGGNTRTTLHNAPFPLTVVRGEGCRLWDADGHEYIDVLGEYTAGIYGHSHPVIRAAIDRALEPRLELWRPQRRTRPGSPS